MEVFIVIGIIFATISICCFIIAEINSADSYILKIAKLIKRPFCRHKKYDEYWLCQGVRIRICKKCGLDDVWDENKRYSKINNAKVN